MHLGQVLLVTFFILCVLSLASVGRSPFWTCCLNLVSLVALASSMLSLIIEDLVINLVIWISSGSVGHFDLILSELRFAILCLSKSLISWAGYFSIMLLFRWRAVFLFVLFAGM